MDQVTNMCINNLANKSQGTRTDNSKRIKAYFKPNLKSKEKPKYN